MIEVTEDSVVSSLADTGLLKVTLNRPAKRNALGQNVLDQLRATFGAYREDARVKVAVLRGAGDKSFAAGGDLKELSSLRTLEGAESMSRRTREILDAVRSFPVPVVAALNGDALGGGSELAAACDMRVAAAHARVGFIQGRLAITTAWGGAFDLMALVGPTRALALLCRSDLVSASDAVAMGLVNVVVAEGDDLDAAVEAFCKPMLDKPRHVLASFKAVVRAQRSGASRAELEALESRLFAEAWIDDAHWRAADKALTRRSE